MFDSVRVRLTLWYTGVLALVLVCLSIGTYYLVARTTERRTFISLAEISQGFLTTLQSEYKDQLDDKAPDALRAAALESVMEFQLRDHRFAVLDSAGNVLAQNQALPAPREPAGAASQGEIPGEVLRNLVAGTAGAPRRLQDLKLGDEHFRARVLEAEVGGSRVSIVTLESLERERELLEDIRATLLWVIPIALLIASAGGYFLARKSLAPVVGMSEKAALIGAQNLHERLPVPNQKDELGYLASTFNGLLERLDRAFEQQRRFMADASHELRSPVAIIRGEAEVALSQARAPEEYRESLAVALDEARRLSQIVDDLFTLARADAGEYPLRPRDFYLEELTADCVRAARTMAAARGIALSYEPDGEMPIHADETLVRRLAMNLLDNAIKFTPEGGRIRVACARAGGEYSLTVRDSGPGIPAEAREKIFERFFRLDPARTPAARAISAQNGADQTISTRTNSAEELDSSAAKSPAETAAAATAGAGLGLAIARWIAEAHQGRLTLVQSDASGSVFVAYLPVNGAGGAAILPANGDSVAAAPAGAKHESES
jgi:two-component system, OmpR family, sensor kinase